MLRGHRVRSTVRFESIIGDSRGNRFAGDRFAPLAGEANERKVGIVFANQCKKLDAVPAGRFVIRGDDTVDVGFGQVIIYTRTRRGYHDGRVFPVNTISPER